MSEFCAGEVLAAFSPSMSLFVMLGGYEGATTVAAPEMGGSGSFAISKPIVLRGVAIAPVSADMLFSLIQETKIVDAAECQQTPSEKQKRGRLPKSNHVSLFYQRKTPQNRGHIHPKYLSNLSYKYHFSDT